MKEFSFCVSMSTIPSCRFPPRITKLHPDKTSTFGYIQTNIFGEYFGDISTPIPIVQCEDGTKWTDVTRHNTTYITAKTPQGTGANIGLSISVDGIKSVINNVSFSYGSPNITSIISPPFDGGTVGIQCENFGTDINKIKIDIDEQGCGTKPCENVQMDTTGKILLCQYKYAGTKGQCRGVVITVDSQSSSRVEYCYDVDKGEISGVPKGIQEVTETKRLTYSIGLSLVPSATVQLILNASSTDLTQTCVIKPSHFLFQPENFSAFTTTQTIEVTTQGNLIDEGTGIASYSCKIEHSVISSDPQYQTHPLSIIDVNIINDDNADIKLWTINSETNQYDYDVKFVGPLSINEGEQIAYGVRLDTEPKFPVKIYPNITLIHAKNILAHPVLLCYPEYIIFTSTNWSVIQRLKIKSMQDKIDNDNVRFQISHEVTTEDNIMFQKATARPLLTVLDVLDDDTAAIILKNPNKLVQLKEGDIAETFTISRFATKLLANATITITSPSALLSVVPTSFKVIPSDWKTINKVISVSALDGNYDAQTTFDLSIESTSDIDLKYTNLSTAKTIVVSPVPKGLNGVPSEALIIEGDKYQYKLTLTKPPDSKNVNIDITSNDNKCTILPEKVTFTPSNYNNAVKVSITVKEDGKLFAKASISYICKITHAMTTLDTIYASITETPTFDLTVTSTGCGLNEEILVRDEANNNQATCICEKDYYLPIEKNCMKCPLIVSTCPKSGLKAPYVSFGYWRHDPTDRKVDGLDKADNANKFFKCPLNGSCLGGNSTKGRCREGHDETGPLCATCKMFYAFKGTECVKCEGRRSSKEFSPVLLIATLIAGLFFSLATLRYLTATAMTKKDMRELKRSMTNIKILKPKIRRNTFLNMVKEQDKSFMDSQLENAFEIIDADGSGEIDANEFNAWKTENKNVNLSKHLENVSTVSEARNIIENEVVNKAFISMWETSYNVLKMTEKLLIRIKIAMKEIRLELNNANINVEWPFIQFDIDLIAAKNIFKNIVKSFLLHMDEADFLLNCLNNYYQELKARLTRLTYFELKLGKYNVNIEGSSRLQ